jgi:hypothetical protein
VGIRGDTRDQITHPCHLTRLQCHDMEQKRVPNLLRLVVSKRKERHNVNNRRRVLSSGVPLQAHLGRELSSFVFIDLFVHSLVKQYVGFSG